MADARAATLLERQNDRVRRQLKQQNASENVELSREQKVRDFQYKNNAVFLIHTRILYYSYSYVLVDTSRYNTAVQLS